MLEPFLSASAIIDFDHPDVMRKARILASGRRNELDRARACFLFVRDEIRHSWDYQSNPVTCKASEVMIHGTGYCYAKSHLLAALLRANGIPAGLCYQRLTISDNGQGPPYGLHGLNAVFLREFGWYRIDARGNKPGVNAQFNPPYEQLAFAIRGAGEINFPEIWPDPLPVVINALQTYTDIHSVALNLPNMEKQPVVR